MLLFFLGAQYMSEIFFEEEVNLNNSEEKKEIVALLKQNNLAWEKVDYTLRILDQGKHLAGTGSVQKNIIKCVAVAENYQGSNALGTIITHLLEHLAKQNLHHVFVFTKPSAVQSFANLYFKEIERVEPSLALMEYGTKTIKNYQDYLQEEKFATQKNVNIGAVVVNCNPFTLGHRYVVEQAASNCAFVYVLVVQEDVSAFPFKIRFELVKKGLEDLKNVRVLRGDEYLVSASTFPTYFLKDESVDEIGRLQAELDVKIFTKHIAPILGINHRFVGTEPLSPTTAAYNAAMQKILPKNNIKHIIIPRKQINADEVISASTVRAALRKGNWDLVKKLVPKTTFDFLKSKEAVGIIGKLKSSYSRH
jgi:[citrate (pro-3S)-lyase] ligase